MLQKLKVCLNGGRDEPGVPRTPDEVSRSAREAVAAGAEAVHVHPVDGAGRESLDAGVIAAGVAAAREALVPVGVSTGIWITGGDAAARAEQVRAWAELADKPDFASVNVGEPGFTELVGVLRGAGIGVEAGVWSVADARWLAAQPDFDLLRVLVEVMPGTTDPAEEILDALEGVRGPRLLHGEGEHCWPHVALAGKLGLPTRIGFEDTAVGPGGEPVGSNADLVRLALRVWEDAR
ncbi:3-keto-5-aminohexanoate cleavage protein [Actinokineospora bangkokensis]|uniref:3-keto-5-aminohexanoate cleavage protein n=1 Tax=Actinokineospora bangkokensis TaxID=1193682 RepID=A0A1Q9LRX8_9PSEU|nr:3-keto-5-aminohexanoate cleavage protein [Actinokineospora bangkokensis]OLR94763.1 hypothetical protein BJP25_12515 [Actinokineospora bangkokensis]